MIGGDSGHTDFAGARTPFPFLEHELDRVNKIQVFDVFLSLPFSEDISINVFFF